MTFGHFPRRGHVVVARPGRAQLVDILPDDPHRFVMEETVSESGGNVSRCETDQV